MEGWVHLTKLWKDTRFYVFISFSYQMPIIYLIVYLILLNDQTALDVGQELIGTVESFEHSHCITEQAIIGE